MQKREKQIHKIYEKGVKVECANIQIFARTQHLYKSLSRDMFTFYVEEIDSFYFFILQFKV